MRKALLLFTAMLVLSFSGCFLTNEMGLQPLRSFRGDVVRHRLEAVGVFAFNGSIEYGYCRRFTSQDECRSHLGSANLAEAGVMAGLTISKLLDVGQSRFYTAQSVYKCENEFIKTLLLMTSVILRKDEVGSSTVTQIPDPSKTLKDAALISAYTSARACNEILEEPGPIFSSPFRETDGYGFWQKQ